MEHQGEQQYRCSSALAAGSLATVCARQFTSVEPGAFLTEFANNAQAIPQPPAYADPSLPTSVMRQVYAHPESLPFELGDPAKGVEKIFELSRLSNPPLQFPLGRDAIKFLSDATAEHTKIVEEYASWSDGLVLEK